LQLSAAIVGVSAHRFPVHVALRIRERLEGLLGRLKVDGLRSLAALVGLGFE